MRTFQYVCFEVAFSSKQPLRVFFAKTEKKSDFKCVFFYSYIKNNVHYGLVIIVVLS